MAEDALTKIEHYLLLDWGFGILIVVAGLVGVVGFLASFLIVGFVGSVLVGVVRGLSKSAAPFSTSASSRPASRWKPGQTIAGTGLPDNWWGSVYDADAVRGSAEWRKSHLEELEQRDQERKRHNDTLRYYDAQKENQRRAEEQKAERQRYDAQKENQRRAEADKAERQRYYEAQRENERRDREERDRRNR